MRIYKCILESKISFQLCLGSKNFYLKYFAVVPYFKGLELLYIHILLEQKASKLHESKKRVEDNVYVLFRWFKLLPGRFFEKSRHTERCVIIVKLHSGVRIIIFAAVPGDAYLYTLLHEINARR